MTYDLSSVSIERGLIHKRSVASESGCWNWIGAKDGKGYGIVARWPEGRRGKPLQIKAHRASWLAFNGAAGLRDLCVLHRCDNPSCVNPEHLFLGTKTDNARDRDMKGRSKLWRGKPGNASFRVGD